MAFLPNVHFQLRAVFCFFFKQIREFSTHFLEKCPKNCGFCCHIFSTDFPNATRKTPNRKRNLSNDSTNDAIIIGTNHTRSRIQQRVNHPYYADPRLTVRSKQKTVYIQYIQNTLKPTDRFA